MMRRVQISKKDVSALRSLNVRPHDLKNDFILYAGTVVRKPWGYEYLAFENEKVALWILYIRKGFRTSLHCHPHKKTSLIVLQGQARCTTLLKKFIVRCGRGLIIDAGVFHSTEAISRGGIVIMEVETPNNKRDLVRLEDAYGREGKNYEGKECHVPLHDLEYTSIETFHDTETRYDTPKRIGEFDLVILRCRSPRDFLKFWEGPDDHLLVVLDGSLEHSGGAVLSHGDVESVLSLRKKSSLGIVNAVEFLIIKSQKPKKYA